MDHMYKNLYIHSFFVINVVQGDVKLLICLHFLDLIKSTTYVAYKTVMDKEVNKN